MGFVVGGHACGSDVGGVSDASRSVPEGLFGCWKKKNYGRCGRGTRLRFGRGWCVGREPGVSPRGFSVAGRRGIMGFVVGGHACGSDVGGVWDASPECPERLFGCWKKRDYGLCGRRTRLRFGRGRCVGREPGVSPREAFRLLEEELRALRSGGHACGSDVGGVSDASRSVPEGLFGCWKKRDYGLCGRGTRLRFGRGWCVGREPGVSPRGFSVAGRRGIMGFVVGGHACGSDVGGVSDASPGCPREAFRLLE
jgi:hypothetical protein